MDTEPILEPSRARLTPMTVIENTPHESVISTSAIAPVLRRLWAFACDYMLIVLYLGALGAAAFALSQISQWFSQASTAHMASFLLVTLPIGAYFAFCEASASGATVGKRLMRIQVRRFDGSRLALSASLLRTAIKFTPWELSHTAIWRYRFASTVQTQDWVATSLLTTAWLLIVLNLGCVAADKRRRTLYDFVAGSIVVRKPQE